MFAGAGAIELAHITRAIPIVSSGANYTVFTIDRDLACDCIVCYSAAIYVIKWHDIVSKYCEICLPCLTKVEAYLAAANNGRHCLPGSSGIYVKRVSATLLVLGLQPAMCRRVPDGYECSLCCKRRPANLELQYASASVYLYVCTEHQLRLQESRVSHDKVRYARLLTINPHIVWALRESGLLCKDLYCLVGRLLARVAELDSRMAALDEPWLSRDL